MSSIPPRFQVYRCRANTKPAGELFIESQGGSSRSPWIAPRRSAANLHLAFPGINHVRRKAGTFARVLVAFGPLWADR